MAPTASVAIWTAILFCVAIGIFCMAQSSTVDQYTARNRSAERKMRELWSDRVYWTRLKVVSTANNLASAQASAVRLSQNQTAIANLMGKYLGQQFALLMRPLLDNHIKIADQLVAEGSSATAEDQKIAEFQKRWVENSDDIAKLLSATNPTTWIYKTVKTMMRTYMQLTTNEIIAYISGEYENSIKWFDKAHNQALRIADLLSNGLTAPPPVY